LRLLLDTHALIWWLAGEEALGRAAREAIEDESNAVFVSSASAMEVATKYRLGKLPSAALLAREFVTAIAEQGFAELPITVGHALRAGEMRIAHKDPFDRLLIAQAQLERLVLVSNETLFDNFEVERLF
jgi:PIN domain nuclease of toxin-antitoxin system